MGDGLKLSKDKRHRSSSSLAGTGLDGTRSERKLDIRASIPEVDDQFALAEARCDDLQEKIDLVKVLKRKRKLKKRSMTRVNEQQQAATENVPFITVRTQPKKKVSPQAARLRRLEMPPNPTRGYLDPATVEQHRMLWGYGQNYKEQNNEYVSEPRANPRSRPRRARADGDGGVWSVGQGVQISAGSVPTEVACGQDDLMEFSDTELFDRQPDEIAAMNKSRIVRNQEKNLPSRRRNFVKENSREVPKWIESSMGQRDTSEPLRRRQNFPQQYIHTEEPKAEEPEERPVVELFNKSRSPVDSPHINLHPQSKKADKRIKKGSELLAEGFIPQKFEEETGPLEDCNNMDVTTECKKERHPRRVKYRSRGYEMPTVASQMKQAEIRYHGGIVNRTNIPFVISKSTAPSHNIGVNIQQVLNGVKLQHPLSTIPLTIAHHMGLGHVPNGTKSATTQPSLNNRKINAIKVGHRLLVLPSYKYMSYRRLLSLYREGDGMVGKFLRAISRPHYFYTSMYNLATNRDDLDGATSKGRGGGGSRETRERLLEYSEIYREYEKIDKRIKEGNNQSPELERRREELLKELTAREEVIRKLVQDATHIPPNIDFNATGLRASASTAEDAYRHSMIKINGGDHI